MTLALVLVSHTAAVQAQEPVADPPSRVARLAYTVGEVSYAPAGASDWSAAVVNMPITTGDSLSTGRDARAELGLGDASYRIDAESAFNVLSLDDDTAQVELNSGALSMAVRNIYEGQSYEVDTPTIAFVAGEPGLYRIDVAADGSATTVKVLRGNGTAYGQGGASYPVAAGRAYTFANQQLADVGVFALPPDDDFDQWGEGRDRRHERVVAEHYVSPSVVGADDLDDYGNWQPVAEYGNVWFPTTVEAGWAPYRAGHWAWVDPWGWTWVDSAPWGFAPFHYGRWVQVRDRWGWMPGQVIERPVYSPALVAFVGGGDGSGGGIRIGLNIGGIAAVGWFPLGPRDVYVPPYRASPRYFSNVNVTNVNNVYVNKTVINNYYTNVVVNKNVTNVNYMYRGSAAAATVVPHDAFVGARPVGQAKMRFDEHQIATAAVNVGPPAVPTRESQGLRPSGAGRPSPGTAFQRPVIAHAAPPPPPPSFAVRQPLIERNNGAPVSAVQMRSLVPQRPVNAHVNVVGGAAVHAAPGAPPPNVVPALTQRPQSPAQRNAPILPQAPARATEAPAAPKVQLPLQAAPEPEVAHPAAQLPPPRMIEAPRPPLRQEPPPRPVPAVPLQQPQTRPQQDTPQPPQAQTHEKLAAPEPKPQLPPALQRPPQMQLHPAPAMPRQQRQQPPAPVRNEMPRPPQAQTRDNLQAPEARPQPPAPRPEMPRLAAPRPPPAQDAAPPGPHAPTMQAPPQRRKPDEKKPPDGP